MWILCREKICISNNANMQLRLDHCIYIHMYILIQFLPLYIKDYNIHNKHLHIFFHKYTFTGSHIEICSVSHNVQSAHCI